ncbi:MAG: tail fiber domain-containing protein, partial [Planctomycetes bacterium]|nr:tail fiber domain-containing protein [Planctomycetota bacterium]
TSATEYWLQIEVRNPAGGNGGYSLLGARQRMSAAPYSTFSGSSDSTRGINVDSLGRVTLNPTGPGSQNDVSFAVTAANAGMLSSLAVSNGGFQNRLETLVDATSAGNPGGVTLRVHSPGIAWGKLNLNPTGNVTLCEQEGKVGIGETNPLRALHLKGDNVGLTLQDTTDADGATARWAMDTQAFGQPGIALVRYDGAGANSNKSIFVSNDGNVGIGTNGNATRGKVEINGSAGLSGILNHGFFGPGGVAANIASFAGATSLHATGDIHAWVFRAFSDSRIKNIVGRSDAAKDLDTLQKIEITDYTFKDTIGKGAEPQKKVIGQQVEAVYPLAVRKTSDIIPDIYKKAPVQAGWVMLATDLKVGDKVRVIGKDAQTESVVSEVKDGSFRVTELPAGDEVFVYGREVSDFLNVDYEAIAMLNVSATQEIARRNLALEQRVRELEGRIEAVGAKSAAALSARIEKLEALLSAVRVAEAPAK